MLLWWVLLGWVPLYEMSLCWVSFCWGELRWVLIAVLLSVSLLSAIKMSVIVLIFMAPFGNHPPTRSQCYKTFYCGNLPPFHSIAVILCYKTFLWWHTPQNYSRNPDKTFHNIAQGGKHKYCSNLLQDFTPRKSRVKITMVIYRGNVL